LPQRARVCEDFIRARRSYRDTARSAAIPHGNDHLGLLATTDPATAVKEGKMVKRYCIDGVNPTGGRFSHVGEVAKGGQIFYLAGQTAGRPDGNVARDIRGQAAQVFKNIEGVLKGCGMSFDNIVKTTTYLVNPDDISVWREEQAKALGPDIVPASTLLIISRLARPEYLIEVEVVAAKD
jgi:2-iminobutanoate/2-iminopropanoate deaminase